MEQGVWKLASFPGTCGLTGPLGLSSGPGTMSHRRGAADEPALDTQGNGKLLQGGGEQRPGSKRVAWLVPPLGHLCDCFAIPLNSCWARQHSPP